MMKAALFISLFISIQAHGCEKEYSFQLGPFFSTSMNIQIWSEFSEEVSRLSGCKIQMVSAPSYENYLDQIILKKHDLYLAPDSYGPSMAKRGLTVVLHTDGGITGYIVSRYDIKKNKQAFTGTRLITPSPYTRIHLEAKDWLAKHGLTDTVTLTFSSAHDASIMALLNKKAETTAVISNIYNKLPESIKSNLYTYKIPNVGGGIITGHKLPNSIKSAIIKARGKIKLSKWSNKSQVSGSRFNKEFEALFHKHELSIPNP